jgi:hypothetical protein
VGSRNRSLMEWRLKVLANVLDGDEP